MIIKIVKIIKIIKIIKIQDSMVTKTHLEYDTGGLELGLGLGLMFHRYISDDGSDG